MVTEYHVLLFYTNMYNFYFHDLCQFSSQQIRKAQQSFCFAPENIVMVLLPHLSCIHKYQKLLVLYQIRVLSPTYHKKERNK